MLGLLISYSTYSQKRYVSIDGTKIWINTIGIENRKAGDPIIVFESGLGTPMPHWDRILEGASELAPLVTYDRPGIGESEPDDEMPTMKNVADKLLKILNNLDLEPPYLLVGHSLGGVYVRGFAVYYPEMLAGLVIIDPADFTETQENKRDYYRDLNWSEAKIDDALTELKKGLAKRREGAPLSIQEESKVLADLREVDYQVINENPLPNIPVHIITGGRYDMPERLRSNENYSEVVFRSKMKHRVARWKDVIQSVDNGMLFYSSDAGHFVHYDDPELVISSIGIALQDYALIKEGKKE